MSTIFANIRVLMDSRIYLFIFDEESQVEVNMVYRLSMQTDLIFKYLGVYVIGSSELKVNSLMRYNLNGLKLRASLVITNNDTLNHLHDYKWVLNYYWYFYEERIASSFPEFPRHGTVSSPYPYLF